VKKRSFPFSFPLDASLINRHRAYILNALCSVDAGFCSLPVSSVKPETLRCMLKLYDTLFFSGVLADKLPALFVSLSSRMTSSAGKFICMRGSFRRIKHAEIRMSSDFLFRLENGPFELNGLSVDTPQEAFLIVFEHELCHAIETLFFGETSHSSRFLSIANGLFGHTATRHRLPTRRQAAFDTGLTIGSRVSFPYQNNSLFGVVTYIGKMATVMVPSHRGDYQDKNGHRYTKYRVPLSKLTLIST